MPCYSDGSCDEKRWKFINWMPNEGIAVQKAIALNIITSVVVFILALWWWKIKVWSAVILALIFGQVVLNAVFLPNQMSFWTEMTSWTAIYGFMQLLTPIAVYLYAIVMAWNDKKAAKTSRPIPPASPKYANTLDLL